MAGIRLALAPASAAPSVLGARLLWEARRLLRRLGWAASGGIGALALAAASAWQAHGLEQHGERLAHQLARLRAGQDTRATPAAPAPPSAAHRVDAFYAYLPAHDALPGLLKELVAVAAKNGVTLAKADYKATPEDGAAFMRYQITLPIKADHAKVQAFIVGALHGLPTLTLDAITFKRERIDTGEVEARIHFNLLVRKAVAKGVRP